MNYSELVQLVQETCETTFTSTQLEFFTRIAEEKLYDVVQPPALRKNATSALTPNVQYLQVPQDFRYVYSLSVWDNLGGQTFLVNKDVNFIREAYPYPQTVGFPKYYANFDADSFILGPTPDTSYVTELHYGYFPESIVTAGTTWLSEKCSHALLNGTLVQAIRFMKGSEDLVKLYESHYSQSLLMLKTLADGKLREDVYRSGQTRIKVN
jgi:hypothetical protein